MNELQTETANATPPNTSASFVRITPPEIVHRRMAAWNGIHADIIEMQKRDPFEYSIRPSHHLLIMAERAARDDGETLIEGLPLSTQREFSRKLTLVPAGHQFHGWQNPRTLMRTTYFYVDPQNRLVDPEVRFAEAELKPRLFFFDHDLWDTAAKLKAQAESSGPGNQHYAEALGAVLAHEILRLNNAAAPRATKVRGGLAGWQKSAVVDYVEEHLADDVPLATLAGLARLSPFHFARAFKQSFGLPPHRYLASRRIERAKSLLTRPQLSVTEIGMQLGFADTSSFSAAFRKNTGLAPREYRRSME